MLLEERIITEEYQGKFWTLMNLYMKSQDGKIKELLLWTEKESQRELAFSYYSSVAFKELTV